MTTKEKKKEYDRMYYLRHRRERLEAMKEYYRLNSRKPRADGRRVKPGHPVIAVRPGETRNFTAIIEAASFLGITPHEVRRAIMNDIAVKGWSLDWGEEGD